MPEKLEHWRQVQVEALTPGNDVCRFESFVVTRYHDGWYFWWTTFIPTRGTGRCQDLARFFDEDHIWEMRNFMDGKWDDRGVKIVCPDIND